MFVLKNNLLIKKSLYLATCLLSLVKTKYFTASARVELVCLQSLTAAESVTDLARLWDRKLLFMAQEITITW